MANDNVTPISKKTDDERFLNLIVCAGSRDRFKAMDIRRDQGVEAAVEFRLTCNVTTEGEHGEDDEDEPPMPYTLLKRAEGYMRQALAAIAESDKRGGASRDNLRVINGGRRPCPPDQLEPEHAQ